MTTNINEGAAPLERDGAAKQRYASSIKADPDRRQGASELQAHFERAVALLEQKAELQADIREWKKQARGSGLDPAALLKHAKESLLDADQRRKAAEKAEVEALYHDKLSRLCPGLFSSLLSSTAFTQPGRAR